MKQRITLYADEGMILTDGKSFGRLVHLAVGADASKWHEIAVEEYESILAEQEPKEIE
jgi:hypothetical protein